MLKKIIATFGTRLFTALINFGVAVVVSQYLGASGKGEQGILIAGIAMVLIFSNIVGGASLVYLAPRNASASLLTPAWLWSVLMGLLWGVLLGWLGMIPPEWVPHIIILSVLNSWISVHSGILIGHQKVNQSNLINLLHSVTIITVLLILLAIVGMRDIRSYIFAYYAGSLVSLALSVVFIWPQIKGSRFGAFVIQKIAVRDLFRYGFINQLAHIAQILSFRISYFFLDQISGEKAVGVYSNGVSLMESVWMISGSIALVQYSRIVNTDNKAYAQQLTAKLIRYALWASVIITLPMVLFPSGFYVLLFGPEFGDVNTVMRWLAPGIVLFNHALIAGHYFSGTGKYHVNAIASAAGLVITLCLLPWLVLLLSYTGAAITASISYLATSLIVAVWFRRESGISMKWLLPHPGDLGDMVAGAKQFLRSFGANKNSENEKN